MAKSVEKYLNKIAKLIEESSASVGEGLIKRIEDMLNQDDYVLDKLINARPIALAVFHELFSRYNHNRVTKSELETHLPPIALNDTFVVVSEGEQRVLTVEKGDIIIRTDINKHLFNKTGRNEFFSDWIDVSQVFHSEAAMLSISGVHEGDEIFRTDLDKTFMNITSKNESMADWREVVYHSTLSILDPSIINTNREHVYCNLNGTSEYMNLPAETGLFTPETYYEVNGDTSHMLYIHSIYGDTAYGYMLSYDEDGPITQINYEQISFRNSKAIRARHIKSHPVENVINFVKSLPKNFPSDMDVVEANNAVFFKESERVLRSHPSIDEVIRRLSTQQVAPYLEKLTIQTKLSSFGISADYLLFLKEQGLIQSAKCIHSDIYELVIRDKHN